MIDKGIIVLIALVLVAFFSFLAAMKRYVKCPSNRILVKYGKVGKGKSANCIHGGATFVWPFIQSHEFLDLTPMTIDIALEKALSLQNIRVDIPSRFTFGISTLPVIMINAAERLLGQTPKAIERLAEDIILGQLRATIATMRIEEINAEREKFENKVMDNIETELKKIGLDLINVNITDINDESGYIEALGKKAAAEKQNQAKIDIAEEERKGATGQAIADREKRIKVSQANAEAVKGENLAAAHIAESDAGLRVKQAEATKLGDVAEKVRAAEASEEAYKAQKIAEEARRTMESARQTAEKIVPAEIAKNEVILQAQAEAEKQKQAGIGEGNAIRARMEGEAAGKLAVMRAEAQGVLEVLSKKAEGLRRIVQAAGGSPDKAAMLMVIEKLENIAEIQATAIQNIKFDKVTVIDSGGSGDGTGTATSKWLSNITKVLPGIHEIAKTAGVELPKTLGAILSGAGGEPKTGGETPPSGGGTPSGGGQGDVEKPETILAETAEPKEPKAQVVSEAKPESVVEVRSTSDIMAQLRNAAISRGQQDRSQKTEMINVVKEPMPDENNDDADVVRSFRSSGYEFKFDFDDLAEQFVTRSDGTADMGGMTHHLSTQLIDENTGKPVTNAKVKYKIYSPSKSARELTTMPLGGSYGADINMSERGDYLIACLAKVGKKKAMVKFRHEIN